MMWLSGGFIFRRGTSLYHRIDPRVRLLVSVLLFSLILIPQAGQKDDVGRSFTSVLEVLGIVAFMLGLGTVAKVLRRVGRTMLLTAAFSAFIFVLNFFFQPGLSLEQRILTSALFGMRFVAIVVSTSLFFITTSPDELEQVMKTFRLPRDIVFAFVTAVRFIPVMMLDTIQIMDAQKSRGLELEKGNLVKRVRNMIPILIPLVVNSVVRSGELAEAMESRAYGAVPRPTSLVKYRARVSDWGVAVAAVFLFGLTAYSFYFIVGPILP